jgi:Fe-Mn family superoxide dismutase
MLGIKPLPYSGSSLEPTISGRTLEFHYGKHHVGYLNKLNELIAGRYDDASLEEIISASYQKDIPIFNNAAQVYNHTFYWDSMTPKHQPPSDRMMSLIKDCFGSFENFTKEFVQNGVGQFGSGWVWLIVSPEKGLQIVKTANADTPIVHGQKPLITCDVWEHAYYLDYQNRRPDYVGQFLDKLVNWEFAEANL